MIGLNDLRGLSAPSASLAGGPATRGQQRLVGCKQAVIKNKLTYNKSVSPGKKYCCCSLEAGVTASFSSTSSQGWCIWRTRLGAVWK